MAASGLILDPRRSSREDLQGLGRCGVSAPRWRRGPVPAARRGVEVGLWWRLRDGVLGSRGCGLGYLKGAPGFWACVPRERRGEIPGGDRGSSVACARRGERDDPDAWARPGSETGRALCGREALDGLRARERVGPREVGRGVRLGGPSAGEGLGRRVWAGKRKVSHGHGFGCCWVFFSFYF